MQICSQIMPLWSLLVPLRIKCFLWLCWEGKLNTRDNLRKKNLVRTLEAVFFVSKFLNLTVFSPIVGSSLLSGRQLAHL